MGKGYNLKRVRTQKGYSQLEIAELLNTTQQQYSKYETGAQELPARHIVALSKFYKVPSDTLLGLETKEEKGKL